MVECLRSAENISTAEAVYRIVDEIQKIANERQQLNLACSQGCTHCCHTLVSLTRTEAEAIKEFLLRRPVLFNRLRPQMQQTVDAWRSYVRNLADRETTPENMARDWIGQPCMFLNRERQECEIYDFRPIACRSYGSRVRCTSPSQPEANGYASDALIILYSLLLEDEEKAGPVMFAPLPVWMALKLKDRL